MAKAKSTTIFLCNECGYETSRWLGRCPSCGAWDALKEFTPPTVQTQKNDGKTPLRLQTQMQCAVPLCDIPEENVSRLTTGMGELDRVLGGGIVNAMAVLLSGDPGIGKSTLLMQAASCISATQKVLYVTGEESLSQLKLRGERIGAHKNLLILSETDVNLIISEAQRVNPDVLIIDSIQTTVLPDATGVAGSVSQVSGAATLLISFAKSTGTALFIVGHVTKDGSIAGPRLLEHMVDTVLCFEGDRHDSFRLLRTLKNRFGSTNEIGVFEMRDNGINEVSDPSSIFLSENTASGCAVTAITEGTRPILVEIQALLSPSPFNNPRRLATGVDNNRLAVLLAVLEQKAGLKLYDKDVYLNAVGGIRIDDRGSDLAIAVAVASAAKSVAPPAHTAMMGEIGLTGELRPISRTDVRVNECIRLGFTNIIIPRSKSRDIAVPEGICLCPVGSISEAVACLT